VYFEVSELCCVLGKLIKINFTKSLEIQFPGATLRNFFQTPPLHPYMASRTASTAHLNVHPSAYGRKARYSAPCM
jgi:hypothetical protein